jgi:hypothetical protein
MQSRTRPLSILTLITAVAFGSAASAISGAARAEEPVQISGTVIHTGGEFHQITTPNDADQAIFVSKNIGNITVPGLLSMTDTALAYGEITHGVGHYKGIIIR